MRIFIPVVGAFALAACVQAPEDGPEAAMCNGLQGLACGAGEYCFYPQTGQCGAADQTGFCRPRPQACTMEYNPVCGCDGRTYSNACIAASEGASVASTGECRR